MSSLKVLITGGSGLLGEYLNEYISRRHSILTVYNSTPGNCINYNNVCLNLTDRDAVERTVTEFKPDVIVHTAAISTPVQAEQLGEAMVRKVNILATEYLAELSNRLNAKLIFTSTDLVYAGYRGSMLTESSKLIPISLYAESKLLAEERVRKIAENYIVLRTSLLYGKPYGKQINHFDQMVRAFAEGKRMNLFTDQWRTPLSLDDAAETILKLISLPAGKHTLNFGGRNRVSRAEMGEIVCDILGYYKAGLINYTSAESLPGYPNVADVSMDTSELQALGVKVREIEDAVRFQLEKYR